MKKDGRTPEEGAMAPALASTQDLFWNLIAAPEGVRSGMEALRRQGRFPAADLAGLIRGDDRMAPEDRLDIYASMYFYRLRDCLAEDYPKVAAVVGGAEFHNLVTDYLLIHPSRHWSLRYLGEPFAEFLAEHRLGQRAAFLGDLARLEWARIEVFDAADAPMLDAEGATAAGADLALSLVPAVKILSLDWNVAPIWRQLEDAGVQGLHGSHSAAVVDDGQEAFSEPTPVEPPVQRPCSLQVWRKNFSVAHRSLDRREAACLTALDGQTVGLPALCELLMEQSQGQDGEELPQGAITRQMATLLGAWLADGVLRG
jgi:hypothetical protein